MTGPISAKLGKKHPYVMGIQVCSDEEAHLFPGVLKTEIGRYVDDF